MPSRPLTPTVPAPSVFAPAADAPPARGAAGGGHSTRFDTRWAGRSPAASADAVWVPTVSGILVLTVGALSLATGQPWLSAGLGPTAMLIASNPGSTTTRFHNIVVGHFAAYLCGVLALLLLGAMNAPTILAGHGVTVVRVWASAFAVAVTALVQPSLRAYHPPAAATALLVTLGVYRVSWKNAVGLLAGVLVVALLGAWFQRLRLRERQARGIPA